MLQATDDKYDPFRLSRYPWLRTGQVCSALGVLVQIAFWMVTWLELFVNLFRDGSYLCTHIQLVHDSLVSNQQSCAPLLWVLTVLNCPQECCVKGDLMSSGNFPGETQRLVVTFPIAVYVLGVSSRVTLHVCLQKCTHCVYYGSLRRCSYSFSRCSLDLRL